MTSAHTPCADGTHVFLRLVLCPGSTIPILKRSITCGLPNHQLSISYRFPILHLSYLDSRKSLLELKDDYGHLPRLKSITVWSSPGLGSFRILDDKELPEIDLTSSLLATCPTPTESFDGSALGLYVEDKFSNATQSPSPEHTHANNFFTYFPGPEKYNILNTDETIKGLSPLHLDDRSPCFRHRLDLHSASSHPGLEGCGWPAGIGMVDLACCLCEVGYCPHVHPPVHTMVRLVTLCSVTVSFITPP